MPSGLYAGYPLIQSFFDFLDSLTCFFSSMKAFSSSEAPSSFSGVPDSCRLFLCLDISTFLTTFHYTEPPVRCGQLTTLTQPHHLQSARPRVRSLPPHGRFSARVTSYLENKLHLFDPSALTTMSIPDFILLLYSCEIFACHCTDI